MLLSNQLTLMSRALATITPALIANHTRQLELAGFLSIDLAEGMARAASVVRELETNAGLVAPVEDLPELDARARRAGFTLIHGGRAS